MDILFPMLYFKGNNFYPFVLDWQEQAHGRHIVPGVGIYRLLPEYGGWSPLEIERQLFTSRAAGTAGTAMFRAQHILEGSAAADIYGTVYDKPALVPPLSWADAPAPQTPASLSVNRAGGSFELSWSAVAQPTGHPATRYNVYAAVGSVVDIENIDNLVCTTADTTFVWECTTSSAVALAVTAVDAYGRESVPALWNCDALRSSPYELYLPEPRTWGMRLQVYDIYGRCIYSGRYSSRVVVAGLPVGFYQLKILGNDGRVVESRWFSK